MRLLPLIAAGVLLVFSPSTQAGEQTSPSTTAERPEIVVFKSPYCGCCGGWAEHMEAEGYVVSTRDMADLEFVKKAAGVPDELQSCHTAIIDGYTIEGHVPASAIDQLLRERPAVKGLAVPGMPIGSPGMEGPDPEAYNVMSFDEAGRSSVFMHLPVDN